MIVRPVTSICTTEKGKKSVLKKALIYDNDLRHIERLSLGVQELGE